MESLPNPPVPQKIGAESKGSAANSNRLFDLRSSLSSVKVGARNGAEVKLRLGKKMGSEARLCPKIEYGDGGYVLEDVPHLTDYLPDLPVYFESDEVHACIVTCGGLCPGLNTVIREIVCGLSDMYGVTKILGIEVIDKSFGFDTAVEEAQRAINAAHVEAESVEHGIGVVKLMGRYSG
ncbi:hypothetical protein GW17_00002697 [Ensete ventricosum]|nr:hypothetical protein GW17_00002697 [Ensete ventricosum]